MINFNVPSTSANLGPGFDTLGLALNLFNKFEVRSRPDKKINISVISKNNKVNFDDADNLILNSYLKYYEYINKKIDGIDITEKMNSPLARGMGSSASAIVGGLFSAAWNAKSLISAKEFIDLAVDIEGHPDNVIPAIFGGLDINYKKGDRFSYHKINIPEELKFIVIIPDFELKTSETRKILPNRLDYTSTVFNLGRISLLITAFLEKNYSLLAEAMEDKLHQPFRSKLIPGFEHVIKTAKKEGAFGASLSGAGPTVIAVTTSNENLIADGMISAFLDHNVTAEKYILKGYNISLYKIIENIIADNKKGGN
ncbi:MULTISPECIES: homoserine kinase [unclassified Halanaerobium]|uniref:homoserine kinase n=1 Tax=unclassified Halanaerobium TaxID=2641197 RepID=UPI000DF4A15C|nr:MULTISPECIES: homoserine kinase [unclassified Halanaerobium]RCW51551.1 homoserine kinase [Halanaerobium sp. MA284_MarDTE_T2]RCW89339.1 homoserine kinase [Halanaerobium sp. DL-01]